MAQARRIAVLKGSAKPVTCRDCRQPILLAVTAPHGRYMPFDHAPRFSAESTNLETGVTFEHWAADLLHFTTCANRPKRTKAKTAPKRTGPTHSILEPGI